MSERIRFILFSGVLGWGVPTGVTWAVVMAVMNRGDREFLNALLTYLISLPLWLIGGLLWGGLMWRWLHRDSPD